MKDGIAIECRARDARQLVTEPLITPVPETLYDVIYDFRNHAWRADGAKQEPSSDCLPIDLVLDYDIVQRGVKSPALVQLDQAVLTADDHAQGFYIPLSKDGRAVFVADAALTTERALRVLDVLGDEVMLSVLRVENWSSIGNQQYLPATEIVFVALKRLYVAKAQRFLIGIQK